MVNPLARSQIGRISSKRPPGTTASKPGALGHVDHIEHVQDGSHEQHRISDDAEDGEPAWDQPCLIQQEGEDPSGHAGDQIDHHDGYVVLCLKQRAQRLRSGYINGAVAQSVTERDHEEGTANRKRHATSSATLKPTYPSA